MNLLSAPEFVQYMSEVEQYISECVIHPHSIDVFTNRSRNSTIRDGVSVGPWSIKRLWFDFHDNEQKLGITYLENSVKTGKPIEIFKPITLGLPLVMLLIWADFLPELLGNMSVPNKQYPELHYNHITPDWITGTIVNIREFIKEMREMTRPVRRAESGA